MLCPAEPLARGCPQQELILLSDDQISFLHAFACRLPSNFSTGLSILEKTS
jgi:hypothetical protein